MSSPHSSHINGTTTPAASSRPAAWLGLVAFLALCIGVGGLGGWATSWSVASWYQTLVKPGFTPPDWLFGPVWTTLYILMAIAAWRVWRRGLALGSLPMVLFFGQLALNCAWSFLFFGLRSPFLGLVGIIPLLGLIILTLDAFRKEDGIAGLLFVPYLAWVSYATALTAAIWHLNG
jgi:tryptophan-rich sensory protein